MRATRVQPVRRIARPGRGIWRDPRAIGAAAILLGAAAFAAVWYRSSGGLDAVIDEGYRLLAAADSDAKTLAALKNWDERTRPRWADHAEELIDRLYRRLAARDFRARWLLVWVSGADYEQRLDDWRRWHDARQRTRDGKQPEFPRGKSVRLEPLWSEPAPIGLTSWFSTILPIDGQIYVASLGSVFNDPGDDFDGVVRVDGRTGASDWLLLPTEPAPRDIIGIAAGGGALFAAALNGAVYSVRTDGQVRWRQSVDSGVVAPPLAIDANRDGTTDVIVVNGAGKVVALSGKQGATLWTATLRGLDSAAARVQPARRVGATLAAADLLPPPGPEIIVTTPGGQFDVLTASNGASRSDARLDTAFRAGVVSGAICTAERSGERPPAYLGDRDTRIWALVLSAGRLEPVRLPLSLAVHPTETLIAGVRTLGFERGRPPLLVACPTGGYGESDGGVCGIVPKGIAWRYGVDGAIWGTPAIADLNGDHDPEIIVGSIVPGADGHPTGLLSIVSRDGHLLRREALPAAIECSPVVADVDGDGRLDILVADQSGLLHAVTTGSIGPVEWGLFGGDSHNTRNAVNAYAYGQLPVGRQWAWKPE